MLAAAPQVVIPSFGGGGAGGSCVRDNHFFCWSWVSENWSGILFPALREHVVLTLIAVAVGFAISLVLGIAAYRVGWLVRPISGVGILLYSIPSLALFQVLVGPLGPSRKTAEVALVSYTLYILFASILTGLREVPAEVRDAAEGMGLSANQILLRVELPLALPTIIAGLRVATVTVISLATVAAYVGSGGLGAPIFTAIQNATFKTELIAAGALAIALALVADGALVLSQRLLTPWARARMA